MRVCLVGQGGREHALAEALARTARVTVCPGNPGMVRDSGPGYGTDGRDAALDGLGVTLSDLPPEQVEADLVVIGPEQPLVDGLADRLRARGRMVFGPGVDGARLEGSKAFMRDVLAEARVAAPAYGVFDEDMKDEALAFLRTLDAPWVVKTDGLAAGKGVLVTDNRFEAEDDVAAKLSGRTFGEAGRKVVIEEGLTGTECSLMVVTDGTRLVPLAPAQDFKRLEEGDEGPNTGGMGAYTPVASVDDRLVDRILDEAVEPTLAALRRRGIDYRGVLYAGLMLTDEGPKVLEYNVRFGDPETQVVLARFDDDLTGLLAEAASGRLRSDPRPSPLASVCVVMAAANYPADPRTGDVIEGLDAVAEIDDVRVFH
ncbi:MAG TPA: phosphoribosylamine--glycine ligase, partial [Acidimicrobiales bacterium]|nr:phosphoribosylamine--glycine ligase [Acidimicrobiales bacterium]